MSTPNNPISIDLSVFDNQESASSCNKDFKSCKSIKKLFACLQYFSNLQLQTNDDHVNIFCQFMDSNYSAQSIIMDYFHLQKKHGDAIYEIMQFAKEVYKFPSCDIDVCAHSSRLYRVNEQDIQKILNEADNPLLYVVSDILAGVHFYLYHLFETGCRSHITDDESKEEEEEEEEETADKYYDRQFAKMARQIRSTKGRTERFDRISDGNKFSLNVDNNDNKSSNDIKNDDESTYMDHIYETLEESSINKEIIDRLRSYVLYEEWDTESMELDLKIGNISNYLNHKPCMDVIINIFKKTMS